MADDQNPAGTEPEDKDPKWYRETLARKDAEIAVLTDTMTNQLFSSVGIDTSRGLGKTMRENYNGDMSRDALLAYAKDSYEWEPPKAAAVVDPAAAAANAAIVAGLGRIATAGQPAGSITPNEIGDQITAAEAKGDWTEAIRLKTQVLGGRMLRSASNR